MLRKRYLALVMLGALPAVAGCTQATRHSNTMVFATSTSLGVKTGTSAAELPAINIGFDRQEAVLMPLLANTSEKKLNANHLSPCRVEATISSAAQTEHPCKFVASKTDYNNEGKRTRTYDDSYSVLASFGARGSAEKKGEDGSGSIGVAQYFATGIAAQILAEKGGASVVSTSTDPEGNEAKAKLEAIESIGGCSRKRLRNYLNVSLTPNERQRREGLLVSALQSAQLGTNSLDLLKLEQGGSESDRQKLISEALKTENNPAALKDLGECS